MVRKKLRGKRRKRESEGGREREKLLLALQRVR